MKVFVKGIALVLAIATTSAQALPTLFFDGDINYYAGTDNELSVEGVLIDTWDLAPSPITAGSSINFDALFVNAETIAGDGGLFSVDSTKGHFTGGLFLNDLEIYDGSSNLLLAASFDSLTLKGANGSNKGSIVGILSATDGLLMDMFDNSNLFALQLNLTTTFSADMFSSDFSGNVDGSIEGQFANVPEPSVLAILSFGLLITVFAKKRKRTI